MGEEPCSLLCRVQRPVSPASGYFESSLCRLREDPTVPSHTPEGAPLHGPGDISSLPHPPPAGTRQYGECVCAQELPSLRLPGALQGGGEPTTRGRCQGPARLHPHFTAAHTGLPEGCLVPAQLSARQWDSGNPHRWPGVSLPISTELDVGPACWSPRPPVGRGWWGLRAVIAGALLKATGYGGQGGSAPE